VTSTRRFRHDALLKLGSEIFRRGGSDAAEADLVIGHLVSANLAGHDSHGVGMIPAYVGHLKAGLVSPNTPAKLLKDDWAILMFDGQRGYGRRVAGEAMESAIALAAGEQLGLPRATAEKLASG
jgi:uncharacterized oxidoreductase